MSRQLQDALRNLAAEADVKAVIQLMQHEIEVQLEEDDTAATIFDPSAAPIFEWEEGVEEFKKKTPDQLWAALGRGAEKRLPYFNHYADKTGQREPHTHEEFFENPEGNPDIIPLVPRWHQLVGILKGLRLAFEGKPLLLMDGVGFGKTMQFAGIVAMVAYMRETYAKMGDFAGAFRTLKPALQ